MCSHNFYYRDYYKWIPSFELEKEDTLVFVNGYYVDPAFEEMLKGAGVHYHLIGDGEKVGNLRDAITRAYEVVKNI